MSRTDMLPAAAAAAAAASGLSPTDLFLAVTVALLGGGAFGAIVVKYMSRGVDMATASKVSEEAKKTAKEAANTEIETIRGVLNDVREERAGLMERVARLEERDEAKDQRLRKLEERERHMLTRAAVHEAWDQLTFQALVAHNPNHPPPPPLTLSREELGDLADDGNPG